MPKRDQEPPRGDPDRPVWVTPETAARMLITSRTRIYQMLARGELQSSYEGRRRMIWTRSIDDYLDRRFRESDT